MLVIGYLAENYGAFPAAMEPTSRNIMIKSGMNVGNFAFWSAACELVEGKKVLVPFGAKPEDFRGKIDLLLIPAANWLNQRQDFGWLADLVEELAVPTVVLGLGAQSDKQDEFPQLKPGTQRFLQAASKLAPFIAVRGEYTARACKSYGIDNVEALGCPSILLNRKMDLGSEIEKKWNRTVDRLAIHSLNIKPHSAAAERRLLRWALERNDADLILQAPRELVMVVANEQLPEAADREIDRLDRVLQSDISREVLQSAVKRRGYIPFSADSWRFFLSFFSHSVNTRIHGTVMSLMAEVPSICFLHDTRTRELCDVLGIPSLESHLAEQFDTPEDLFAAVRFDGSAFDTNRAELMTRNLALLKAAGFPVRSEAAR